jgi:hypothetical protein
MKDTILDLLVYGLVIFFASYMGSVYAMFNFTNALFDLGYLK